MAKQTRTKKTALTEPVKEETPEIVVTPEPEIEEVQEVQDAAAPEAPLTGTIVMEVTKEPIVEKVILKEEPVEVKSLTEPVEEKSMEQKIMDFIDSREGDIKMNDFLRSLYPVPKFNEPQVALSQGSSRYLRMLLDTMQGEGKLIIQGNQHRRLGEHYYDTNDGKAYKHNLNTIQIIAKK